VNIEVYCDESCQEYFATRPQGEYFVLIGSIWVPAELRTGLKQKIEELRQKHGIFGEAKWGRVSKHALPFYKDFVDLFFENDLRFRVMVIRTDELDIRWHDNNVELMFYKFYYFMLRGWLDDCNEYRIFTDVRTNSLPGRLKTLETVLRNAALTSSVSLQAIPSQELVLMQLADVLTGAVGYRFHDRHASKSKLELITHLEKKLGRPLNAATTKGMQRFNIFRFKPGGGW
jgi:hypothetical protein